MASDLGEPLTSLGLDEVPQERPADAVEVSGPGLLLGPKAPDICDLPVVAKRYAERLHQRPERRHPIPLGVHVMVRVHVRRVPTCQLAEALELKLEGLLGLRSVV